MVGKSIVGKKAASLLEGRWVSLIKFCGWQFRNSQFAFSGGHVNMFSNYA